MTNEERDHFLVTRPLERILTITSNAGDKLFNMVLEKYPDFLPNEHASPILMRLGVKSGGCSGMSYVMDFTTSDDIKEDDFQEDWNEYGINFLIDSKSFLYIFGLKLDYSTKLIGGGFSFQNPNAESTCGCGKSFNI
mmetsp:Transcript_29635/g.38203  ORF Transcript_29635/g.38203 Transcript_29635/m.38203 type:complete len:137 (+) Transcript_29635:43-453(+)